MHKEPIDAAEFARLVRNGLGRALLHLREHDAAPYREVICHACLHNQMWDRQCEPMRERYLYEMMLASGDFEYHRAQLLASLDDISDGPDTEQRLNLARLLAQHGDRQAHRSLYAVFDRFADSDWPLAAPELVELDGIAGLLYVAERFDASKLAAKDDWIVYSIVYTAMEQSAEQEVRQALLQAARRNAAAARFTTVLDRSGWPSLEPSARSAAPPSSTRLRYAEVRERLKVDQQAALSLLSQWSWRGPPDDELEQAAADLLAETRPPILRRYLAVFWRHRFPLDPVALLALVDHPDASVSLHTTSALRHVRHPEVRRRAFDLLASGRGDGARLLASNLEEGDYALLEGHLYSWRDQWQLEYLATATLDVYAENPVPAAAGCLIAIYERLQCSNERMKAIEGLLELDALPDWMAEECRYDANPDIRELVATQAKDSQVGGPTTGE